MGGGIGGFNPALVKQYLDKGHLGQILGVKGDPRIKCQQGDYIKLRRSLWNKERVVVKEYRVDVSYINWFLFRRGDVTTTLIPKADLETLVKYDKKTNKGIHLRYLPPPVNREFEAILTAMKTAEETVAGVRFIDLRKYANQNNLKLEEVYAAVKYKPFCTRVLDMDELEVLVKKGYTRKEVNRFVTFKVIRRVKIDKSGSPLFSRRKEQHNQEV